MSIWKICQRSEKLQCNKISFKVLKNDEWINSLSQFNSSNKDKSEHTTENLP